jgi:hypothetical protein
MANNEDWDFYLLRVDEAPASIFVDLGLARRVPIASHPHMAYVRVAMREPRPDGLSSQAEFEALKSLEGHLEPSLVARNCIYAGRNTTGGTRDYYFYVADPHAFAADAAAAMARFPSYASEIGTQPDPSWSIYSEFLHPGDDDLQRIMNRRVCSSLAEHGDALGVPRSIDHRAYFPTAKAGEDFASHILAQGFRVIGKGDAEAGQHYVDFERDDVPDRIDDDVIALARLSKSLGGSYDGWGCTPIRAS